jgi:hypothetical protein
MAHANTRPPDDPKMWRRLVSRAHPDTGSEIVLSRHSDRPPPFPDNTNGANVSSNVRDSDRYLSGVDNTDDTDNIHGYFGQSRPQTGGETGQNHPPKARKARKASAANVSVASPPEDPITALFYDPPDWLATQLDKCREQERLVKPTCATVAGEVFGTVTRWAEVEPVLRHHLGKGGE